MCSVYSRLSAQANDKLYDWSGRGDEKKRLAASHRRLL